MIARHTADILEAETSGVFRVHKGQLVLEASFGHLPEFDPGNVLPLDIHNRPGEGLTGYIAYYRQLFNEHGERLENHEAVAHSKAHSPSGKCHSLLVIPLLKRVGQKEELIGLLRADNKKGDDGAALATLGFTKEDERNLTIFAKAAVIAIESAELVEFREKLISSSPDGIIAVDRAGNVTEFNKRAEEILGYARAEILDTPVFPLYVNKQEPYRIGEMLRAATDGYIRNYETAVRSKAGDEIPILHASAWLRDAKGRRVGSVGYFEDLRSQKALEHRESLLLRASNALAQAEALDVGLQRLVEMIVSELGRSFCGILLMDEEGKSLTLRAECLGGQPAWKSVRQTFVLEEWGLTPLLEAGRSFLREWRDERYRQILERLTSRRGFDRDVDTCRTFEDQ
jgi:PAS domain S-box-containing protein